MVTLFFPGGSRKAPIHTNVLSAQASPVRENGPARYFTGSQIEITNEGA
jgi:hypothetical protein